MANNMDLDINVRTKSDSAAINKLTQSIDNLRKKARELENIGSGKGLNKALGDNAKLVDRITDQDMAENEVALREGRVDAVQVLLAIFDDRELQ